MQNRRSTPLAGLLIVLFTLGSCVLQAQQVYVRLQATQYVLLADGKQQTVIRADVHDVNGRLINGRGVQFQTTSGSLSQTRVTTLNGIAETRLISSSVVGTAHITALVEGGFAAISNVLDVEFTDDPEALVTGNNYFLATGSYLEYSATDKMIEARGEKGTARLAFRSFDLTADRYQLKCDETSILRATGNITLKRGKDVVHGIRIYYDLNSGQGYGVLEWKGKLQQVEVDGQHLELKASPGVIPSSYLQLPTLQTHLIVSARSISYFPGDKLQFRRARFFQDQAQILSLPYYEMALNSQELFSDHFVSVGSHGLGLQIPYYYNLTPRSSGVVILSHRQQLGRGFDTSDPGWSIDLLQSYSANAGQRYEGSYGFTGLTHSNWGFRWQHTHEFDHSLQGGVSIDFPHHDSVYSSANLVKQARFMRFGLNVNAGQLLSGPSQQTLHGDISAETNPHPLGNLKGVQYSLGTTVSANHETGSDPFARAINGTISTVEARAFSHHSLNSFTQLDGSLTLGNVWGQKGQGGMEQKATLNLGHNMKGGGSLNLAYDFDAGPGSQYVLGGKHRMSLGYILPSTKHFSARVFGSAYLDSTSTSLIADMAYRLNSNWRVLFSGTLESLSQTNYTDMEFTLGRRIGARELQFTYSTYSHRIYFDLTTTQW